MSLEQQEAKREHSKMRKREATVCVFVGVCVRERKSKDRKTKSITKICDALSGEQPTFKLERIRVLSG